MKFRKYITGMKPIITLGVLTLLIIAPPSLSEEPNQSNPDLVENAKDTVTKLLTRAKTIRDLINMALHYTKERHKSEREYVTRVDPNEVRQAEWRSALIKKAIKELEKGPDSLERVAITERFNGEEMAVEVYRSSAGKSRRQATRDLLNAKYKKVPAELQKRQHNELVVYRRIEAMVNRLDKKLSKALPTLKAVADNPQQFNERLGNFNKLVDEAERAIDKELAKIPAKYERATVTKAVEEDEDTDKGKRHGRRLKAIEEQIAREEAKHLKRVARLEQMRDSANKESDTEAAARANKLLEKEQQRHDRETKKMQARKQRILQLEEVADGNDQKTVKN